MSAYVPVSAVFRNNKTTAAKHKYRINKSSGFVPCTCSACYYIYASLCDGDPAANTIVHLPLLARNPKRCKLDNAVGGLRGICLGGRRIEIKNFNHLSFSNKYALFIALTRPTTKNNNSLVP